MAKKDEVELVRNGGVNWCYLSFPEGIRGFCWNTFKKVAPALCKGLRKGQTRKLIRTQLKKGFKLEIDDGK